jgi:hypothetical protein
LERDLIKDKEYEEARQRSEAKKRAEAEAYEAHSVELKAARRKANSLRKSYYLKKEDYHGRRRETFYWSEVKINESAFNGFGDRPLRDYLRWYVNENGYNPEDWKDYPPVYVMNKESNRSKDSFAILRYVESIGGDLYGSIRFEEDSLLSRLLREWIDTHAEIVLAAKFKKRGRGKVIDYFYLDGIRVWNIHIPHKTNPLNGRPYTELESAELLYLEDRYKYLRILRDYKIDLDYRDADYDENEFLERLGKENIGNINSVISNHKDSENYADAVNSSPEDILTEMHKIKDELKLYHENHLEQINMDMYLDKIEYLS